MNISKHSEDKSLPEVPEVPEFELLVDKNKIDPTDVLSEFENLVETPVEPKIKIDDAKIEEITSSIEAMLFISKDPLKPEKIKDLLGLNSIITVRKAAKSLQKFYADSNRAFELREIADGYLLQSKADFEQIISKMRKAKRKMMLTQNALTTLSIVAYKQPITRAEIDIIRGANSSHHIRTLLMNMLIKVVGKKSTPGCPRLYGTTRNFLEIFGLKSIKDLPQTTESFEEDLKKRPRKNDSQKTNSEKNSEKKIIADENKLSEVKEIKGVKREFFDLS